MVKPEQQFEIAGQNGSGQVLLLGDDGRMAGLLEKRFSQVPVMIEKNVLTGICRLGTGRFSVIFVNAQHLGDKTNQAVNALRRVAKTTRIVLYGEPFAEVYAREALRAGADDYLIWPVPSAELKAHLFPDTPSTLSDRSRPIIDPMPVTAIDSALMETYQHLAQKVPQGTEELIRLAEQLLPQVLHVSWVKIQLSENNPTQQETDMANTPSRTVALSGAFGLDARMLLGPDLAPEALAQSDRVASVGAFTTTLLELAHRDQCLKRLAIIDELTGAYNRRYLEYFLRQVIDQSREEQAQVTLLLFDIDNFKHYNDTYGHAAGDEILKEATRLMKLCCRKHDVVSRIGGDEFAVLFWDTGQPRQVYSHQNNIGENTGWQRISDLNTEAARTHQKATLFISNRFRRILRATHFPSLGPEARGMLTVSGGLAGFPADGTTVEQLLARADDALLAAKRSGKNRIYLVGQPEDTK